MSPIPRPENGTPQTLQVIGEPISTKKLRWRRSPRSSQRKPACIARKSGPAKDTVLGNRSESETSRQRAVSSVAKVLSLWRRGAIWDERDLNGPTGASFSPRGPSSGPNTSCANHPKDGHAPRQDNRNAQRRSACHRHRFPDQNVQSNKCHHPN